jgi:hypothetical protein
MDIYNSLIRYKNVVLPRFKSINLLKAETTLTLHLSYHLVKRREEEGNSFILCPKASGILGSR